MFFKNECVYNMVEKQRRVPTTIYLNVATFKSLDDLQRKTGKSISELCRGFIEIGIKKEVISK